MMAPYTDLPTIEWAQANDARVRIDPGSRAPAPGESEAWADLCALNPRLHNGPILAVRALAHRERSAFIHAGIDGYRGLAVRAHRGISTGVELLAVTGVLVCRTPTPLVLVAKRSESTSSYPGMWELGPAGGIDPPTEGVVELDARALLGQLEREIAEELSAPPAITRAEIVGVVRDRAACSLDIVAMVEVSAAVAHAPDERRWEYAQASWVGVEDLARMDGPAMIPPSRALIRLLAPRVPGFLGQTPSASSR